jgi:Uma2 family endonuclease
MLENSAFPFFKKKEKNFFSRKNQVFSQEKDTLMLDTAEKISALTDLRLEVMRGQIVPKESSEPMPQAIIDYILSPEFDIRHLLTIYDMPKTSINHREIIAKLTAIIYRQLNLSQYGIYVNDMVIKSKFFASFYVPDLTFTLVNNKVYDEDGALENPFSVIEVLSKSTQKKDQTEKKEEYQAIESLQEYVLISQDSYKIQQFLRQGKTSWISKVYDSKDQTCILTVGIEIKLKELYQNTDFGKTDSE